MNEQNRAEHYLIESDGKRINSFVFLSPDPIPHSIHTQGVSHVFNSFSIFVAFLKEIKSQNKMHSKFLSKFFLKISLSLS